MILAAVFYTFVLLQGLLPQGTTILPSAPPPAQTTTTTTTTTTEDAPVPGPTTRTQSSGGGNTTVVIQPATDEELKHAAEVTAPVAMDAGPRKLAEGTINLTNAAMAVPSNMGALARDRQHLLEIPQVKEINEKTRYIGILLMLVSLTLVLLKYIGSPFTGADLLELPVAIVVTLFFGILGFFNTFLLGAIIDIVAALLSAMSADLLTGVIQPNLHLSNAADLIVVPVLAIIYSLAALFLILKIWSQWALLLILTAAAPIYITITGAPLLGIYGAKWWRQWMGTLIDPILITIGLALLKGGMFVALQAGATIPDTLAQLLLIFIFIPLIALPGWHAGAYGGGGLDVLVGAALFRMFRRGRGYTPHQAALPPSNPPIQPNPVALSGMAGGGTGGGTAVTGWKTNGWTPTAWRYARA